MIAGQKVSLGGTEYTVPPLNIAALKKHSESFDKITRGEFTQSQLQDVMVDVIYLSLKRNYPDMTIEKVEDIIDLGNIQATFNAVMATSGFSQGEARPGNP